MRDDAGVYRGWRELLCSRVVDLDAAGAATPVDACPGWDVKDVLSHLAGAVDDILAGRLDNAGSDEWTNAQVQARRDRAIADVVAEWNEQAPAFEAQLATWPPEIAGRLVGDVTSHALDVFGALGDRRGRDTESVRGAFGHYADRLAGRVTDAGLPALRVVADGEPYTFGAGDPGATVRASHFELLRAMTGRRSADQVRALDWDGDPGPYVAVIAGPRYSSRPTALVE